ncbi:WD40/YVTN/BNR-like repeat-containing protein [Tahibacter harae]|uniref:Exo-alpha-sialidase n=1 Tax=Tahibacter harae TaxID=2963937 RepID=A0ABT1QP71_9GAMM|nr:sialidase family protein [Tahibacter harae]MCQ4164088.1 exo-alpha-sialidase [Tahibacter harae]
MKRHLLLSTRKGLFALQRQGDGDWVLRNHSFRGDNVSLALADARDGSWYAALNLGHFGVKLQRSTDEGASWTELAVPAYPAGELLATGDGKEPVPATLKLLWSLETGGRDQPGRLWAGTIPGGLFRSDDAGQSWQLVRALWDAPGRAQWFGGGYDQPGIHSICVDPRDPRVLRVAISCGGVWQSDDGGESWNLAARGMFAAYMPPELREDPNIQDPHRMVQCPAAPDTLWVQHHNGVFLSRDGARNWSEVAAVTPSVFGFAVAVHPQDPDTAWFVPAVKDECRIPVDARLVVARTRDGGRSFQALAQGLPHPAYDLVYRHGLAISRDGAVLAMASTTGGLWLSEDQGDSWQAVSVNLPPVYAVTFA